MEGDKIKIMVFGQLGAGKSTLCNFLSAQKEEGVFKYSKGN